MTKDTSIATQSFMELFFPEPISNEYVESTSHSPRSSEASNSVDDSFINIKNLPVTINDIIHEIPTRIQRDHPIKNVIGPLGEGVKMRIRSGDVSTCLFS